MITTKSATVTDVAKDAGVSIATVSRVLNGHTTVDAELRDRVLAAVERLGYRPNRLARNLRLNSTKVIALVVPDIQNPFFVSVARGVEEEALREGYTLLVCNTDDDLQRETNYFQVLSDDAVAGIIVCSTDERCGGTTIDAVLSAGIGVVALDRCIEGAAVDAVLSDNFGGSRQAVSYLIGLKHRRIGMITGPERVTPGRERRLGYEQAFLDHGLSVDRELIKMTDFKPESAETATEELFNLLPRPTAIFVASGISALGTTRAIYRHGYCVPKDISIVVFDDLDWMASYAPPITAIAQDTHRLGILAGELLLRRVRGDTEPVQECRLPTRLMIRESCRMLDA